MDNIQELITLWNTFPDWLHAAIYIFLGATIATLLNAYREVLTGFLKHVVASIFSIFSSSWRDRVFEREYLNWVVAQYRDLSLVGVQTTNQPQLEEIYVSLSISDYRAEADSRLSASLNDDSFQYDNRIFHLHTVIQSAQRVVILGEPGAGKTTLLQFTALVFARERAGDRRYRRRGIMKQKLKTKQWRLPLFIRLRSIVSDTNFEDWSTLLRLSPYLKPPKGYFQRQLERGRCILLLDGLDEVTSDEDHRLVADAIRNLAAPPYANNQFIVTCRYAGWRGWLPQDFALVAVRDFDQEEIEKFVRSWYRAVELPTMIKAETPTERKRKMNLINQRTNDLILVLATNDRVRHLARNPLLLSIIAIVHRTRVVLPRQRGKLYRECIELLLEQWDIARGVHIATDYSLEQKTSLIRSVAYFLQERGLAEIPDTDLLLVLKQQLTLMGRTQEDVRGLLRVLVERSGIIAERSRNVLSFAHLTFQEYFAAQALSSNPSNLTELVERARLFDPKWKEVILLHVSLIDDASNFIKSIYDPYDEDIFGSRLKLALLCLDDAIKVDPAIKNTILKQLLHIWAKTPFSLLRAELDSLVNSLDNRDLLVLLKSELNEEFDVADIARIKKQNVSNIHTQEELSVILTEASAKDPKLRLNAVKKISRMVGTYPSTVRTLIDALEDNDDRVRHHSLQGITHLQVVEHQVVDRLLHMARTERGELQIETILVLGRVGQLNTDVLDFLVMMLVDKNQRIAAASAAALSLIGQPTQDVVNGLKVAMKERSELLTLEALRSLISMKQIDSEILSTLTHYVNGTDVLYKLSALSICRLIPAGTKISRELLQAIIENISNPDWEVRLSSIETIAVIGRDVLLEVKDPLNAAINDSNSQVAEAALLALITLRDGSYLIHQHLNNLLASPDLAIRRRVVAALSHADLHDAQVVSKLTEVIDNDKDTEARCAAIRVLRNMPVADESVTKCLIRALSTTEINSDITSQVPNTAYETLFELKRNYNLWIAITELTEEIRETFIRS